MLWRHPFILSGVISPLISVAYWAHTDLGSSSFSPIILPFPTVHGFLKARILKWFAIPFSSGPHSNKASGGDGIPVELFQILKDDAEKVLHSICQQI